jgi:hypothetical protein
MNYERLKEVNAILDGSSSRMKLSYFDKNYPETLKKIKNFCFKIDVPFNQMIWHWVNDYPDYCLCKCGKGLSFNRNWMNGYKKSCSAKCAQNNESVKEKRKKTNLEKWGVDNVAKLDSVKEKQASTNKERYGATSSFQNKDVRDKWKESFKSKWGVDTPFHLEDFKEKSKKTNLEKYSVEYFVQSQEYIDKSIETNKKKYGSEWYTQTNEYLEKSKNTSIEKWGVDHYSKTKEYKESVNNYYREIYGVDWYFQSNDFKEEYKKEMLDKYDVEHYTKSDEYKETIRSKEHQDKLLNNRKLFYQNKGFDFISDSNRKPFVILKSSKCNHEFEIHPSTLQRRIGVDIECCSVCNPFNGSSGQEDSLSEWISSLGFGIIKNDKSLIYPMELDIYIPDKKLAFEYNGLYWHSDLYKYNHYHLEKTKKCKESGIQLIHIWEDDWIYKKDIVKSIIRGYLGVNSKLFARKCSIKEVTDNSLVNDFVDNNHIQGKTTYSLALGLFYENEMVSCMLFHKPKKEYELVRFCSRINMNVVGGASKIFNYFIDNYKFDSVTTFSDISMFTGDVYKNMGFHFVHRTPPNYWWIVDGIRKHKFNYSKSKLVKEGFDSDKSEIQIMRERGFYRIFNCGLDKWIWNRKK